MSDQVNSGLLSPWLRWRRMQVARKYMRGHVLDYGCGVGKLAQFWGASHYCGVDRDIESISLAARLNPGYRFVTVLPSGEYFDAIVLLAVIEHVREPSELLERLRDMLTPEGLIILTTPHPAFEWLHSIGANIGLFSSEAADEHETLLDFSKMCEVASHARLKFVDYRRFLGGVNQIFVFSK
jgi:2-polyprenyl-3-methyl-5-hydroxy-6-metoxy-1,4-benzoquinol methylase